MKPSLKLVVKHLTHATILTEGLRKINLTIKIMSVAKYDFYERKDSGSDQLLIAKLSPDWKPWDGLLYPLSIKTDDGDVSFKNYEEHHKFIYNLFKNYEAR